MSALDVFEYDGQQVRTVTVDGEPWFVLTDLCAVLDITNAVNVKNRLDPDGVRRTDLIDSMGRDQKATIVNEPGMFEVVIRSDKQEAVSFRRWITSKVLPSIRKTGTYAVEQSPELQIANALVLASSMIAAKDAQIVALTPRADAWDELASASGDFEVADAAKILARAGVETGQARLFKQLAGLGWIHRGSQGKWKAYQTAVDSGYLAEKPMTHYHPKSGELVLDPPQVRITVRGLDRLRVRLGTLQLVS